MSVSSLPQFGKSSVSFIGGVYRAFGVRAVDGDTIDVIVDVGFEDYRTERVRVAGVNTPEMHDPDPAIRLRAEQAKAFTASAIEGNIFIVRTWKITDPREKYGRYLADVIFPGAPGDTLTQRLITAGLGVAYNP